MSGSSQGVGGFIADIYGSIGNGYQDVLLQDSPLRNIHGEVQLLDGNASVAEPGAAMVGLSGDILPPDTEPMGGFDAIEPGAIDGEYTEIQEPPAIGGPDASGPSLQGPEPGGPDIEGPDIEGPDIDGPY